MEQETKNISHERYQKLKSIIQQANPAKDWQEWDVIQGDFNLRDAPIRLADVLLAIQKKYRFEGKPPFSEISLDIDDLVNERWDLPDDSLDHQSEECKEFLINLLVNE